MLLLLLLLLLVSLLLTMKVLALTYRHAINVAIWNSTAASFIVSFTDMMLCCCEVAWSSVQQRMR
uniref:Secreted peptide n=1 Tax=Octopus bimaculoides TaxID=37653 RepID=A0A0L8FNN3_OCTBM